MDVVRRPCSDSRPLLWRLTNCSIITSDKGGGKCFRPCLSLCLSVCLSARLLKTRAWIWMKCCVSAELGTWTNWLTFEPDPDHSPDAGTGLLSPMSYWLRNFAVLPNLPASCAAMRNFTSGKSHVYARASRGFKMVLFTQPSEDLCRR